VESSYGRQWGARVLQLYERNKRSSNYVAKKTHEQGSQHSLLSMPPQGGEGQSGGVWLISDHISNICCYLKCPGCCLSLCFTVLQLLC
jgi:hypothetical protein